jgi:PHS family inorganic phosphate transporter-like MFS transporter
MLTGIFSTLLIPETKGRSLEELSNEDQEGFVQGMISPLNAAHPSNLLASIGVRSLRVDQKGVLVQDA